jgi:23S rRNA pseudouridine1911/1915/1917 synthase
MITPEPQWVEPEILYEDDDLAIIHKPAGVVTNQAETVREATIQSWWTDRLRAEVGKGSRQKITKWQELIPTDYLHQYGTPVEVFAQRGGIVHRLDKETSGVLLLAKNPGVLAALLKAFRTREVQKAYLCLLHGTFKVKADTLMLPLGRDPRVRTKFTVAADGRAAETQYEVHREFVGLLPEAIERIATESGVRQARKKLAQTYQGFSLVKCWPKTGRTHQLRVHFHHLKHPIVADETYLGNKRYALDELWCPRLFLHAIEIAFTHPRSGKKMTYTADLPAALTQVLGNLQEKDT